MSNKYREEILRRTDLVAVFQKYGGQIPPNARPSADGWLSVHAVDRVDEHPSAAINVGSDPSKRGIYVDKAGLGKSSYSFFDMLALMSNSPFVSGQEAHNHLGREAGVFTDEGRDKKPDRPKPTLNDVEAFQKNLTPETKQFLREKRGLTEENLVKFRVGWNTTNERNSFPVFDESFNLVNIRYHNSKKNPKSLSWGSGYGEARLWGLERLARAPKGSTIILTEGEFDAMLADQETGYIGVSATNGAKGFKKEWATHFEGHHVVLLYDSDAEGRAAVHSLVLPAFQSMFESNKILSIKVVWLYDLPVDKAHKDLTDWIIKDGGSGERLKELIQGIAPHTYPTPISHLEPPIPLESFEQIDHAEYAGKRVVLPLQVYGENTVAYHAVTKVKVSSCPAAKDGKCAGITEDDGKTVIRSCLQPIDIPLGDRVMIASVRATEGQLQKLLRDYVCDKDRRPALTYEDADRLTLREVYAHQVVGAMAADRVELVEKPIYIIGGDLVEIGKYQATGRVITAYRDQQPTMLVDTMERVEEDYQAFSIEKSRGNLEKLRQLKPKEIVEDLSLYVTRIYGRQDIHLGNLLVLLSPLEIDFPGEGRIRGRLACINIGDTGTGKTTVVQSLCEAGGVGLQVSGMTASRTGITYGCEHDERKGWRIKAGAFLKMNRQILVVDEAQDLKSEDLKTMAEGLETGLTRIDRIQNKVFESATRVIFNCNPRHPRKTWEQRTMDGYRYGCEAIKGIFPQMMIRRIDFAMYSTAWDVDKEQIFFPTRPDGVQQVLPADLRALVFYAWNLKPEQIVVKEDVAYYIRQVAKFLSDKFGAADDLPLVYAEDFRKTLARLSVAYAILDLSTTDDFAQVQLGPQHVVMVQKFLERIYGAENCNLNKYAQAYSAAHGLADLDEIQKEIDKKLAGDVEPKKRFYYILHQLLQCQSDEDRVRRGDITEEFNVDGSTVRRDIQFFQRFHLISQKVQNGYHPEPKLNRLISRLERIDPKKYNFDRPYKEVFPES